MSALKIPQKALLIAMIMLVMFQLSKLDIMIMYTEM